MFISYFPIATFIAGVKNDILTGYLPVRFFMSESLSAGYMPWWNPYVNFGIPQYADMSSGFWNPVTWLIAVSAGYNIYTITLELLLYILLGAWGMYKCGNLFGWSKEVKLIAAISYMCCGFTVGHLQHLNWISGAGLLSLCFWSYHLLLTKFSLKGIARSAVLFYLLISSSHPVIIIGAIYFFSAYTVYYWSTIKKSTEPKAYLHFSKAILLLPVLLVAVSSALMIGYTELWPFITRGEKIMSVTPSMNSTTIQSWISFIFPLSTVKNSTFFGNEITLRDNYIGILLFIFLLLSIAGRTKQYRFFWITGILFLILASDNIIHTYCFKYLPLFGYVRLNGEFRIFALFSFIISAANGLQYYQAAEGSSKIFKRICFLISIIIITVFVWACVKIFITKDSILFTSVSFDQFSLTGFFKPIADKLSFYDMLALQGIIQLPILLLIRKSVLQKKIRQLLLIVIADLCLATLLHLPFTGAGTKSAEEIQSLLNESPRGIPIPTLSPISLNNSGRSGIKAVLGSWSFYNKQPGTLSQASYPIEFKNEQDLFQQQVIRYLKDKPFLFFSSNLPDRKTLLQQTTDSITIIPDPKVELRFFSPTHIRARFTADKPGNLILLYQNYPHWECKLNDQRIIQDTYLNAFIKLQIKKPGTYTVDYTFNPGKIKIWMVVSLITFLLLVIFAVLLPENKKQSDPTLQ